MLIEMSEAESRSLVRTSYHDESTNCSNINITTSTENLTHSTSVNLKNPDLQNSTSDNSNEDDDSKDRKSDENENEDNDEREGDDTGTCSRARPYVRGQKEFGLNSSPVLLSKAEEQPQLCSIPMPTPPDELGDDAEIPSTLRPKYATPSETSSEVDEKCAKTNVPVESAQTELHVRSKDTRSNKCDDIKGSPQPDSDQQKGDSQSAEGETSSKEPCSVSICPANVAKTITPEADNDEDNCVMQNKIINLPQQSTNNKNNLMSTSDTCHNKLTREAAATSDSSHYPSATNTITSTTGSRKGSKIPVGIAVAWQRFVTTSISTEGNSTSSVTSAPSISMTKDNKNTKHHHQLHKLSELPCPPSSPIKVPLRPSSASPITPIRVKSPSVTHQAKCDKVVKRSSVSRGYANNCSNDSGRMSESKSSTPELALTTTVSTRPLPSSSVPPNLGLPYFHGSLIDYHYGMRSTTPFPSLSSHHHSHGHFPQSWPSASGADLSVPQGFTSPGAAAAYLQQSMHNQMQLQQHLQAAAVAAHHQSYSNYPVVSSSSVHLQHHHNNHPGLETLRQQYEQFMLQSHQQHQHAELLRQYQYHHQQQQHHHQQQQLLNSPSGGSVIGGGNGYDASLAQAPGPRATPTLPPSGSPRLSIPILSPSPTGGVRTPTPTTMLNPSHHSLSLSNLSAAGILPLSLPQSNWPAELYHHNSSTALSPKSLTSSSTPSPVTVQQHDFSHTPLNLVNNTSSSSNLGAFTGRKCATPNPILSKSFPLSSPTTPSPTTKDVLRKDETKTQVKKKHLSMSTDKKTNDDNKDVTLKCKSSNTGESRIPEDLTKESKHNGKLVLDEHAEQLPSPSPISMSPSPQPGAGSHSHHKHDFTRMESLIEKREDENVSTVNNETTNDSSIQPSSKETQSSKNNNEVCLKEEEREKESRSNMGQNMVVKVETDNNIVDTSQLGLQPLDLIKESNNSKLVVHSNPIGSPEHLIKSENQSTTSNDPHDKNLASSQLISIQSASTTTTFTTQTIPTIQPKVTGLIKPTKITKPKTPKASKIPSSGVSKLAKVKKEGESKGSNRSRKTSLSEGTANKSRPLSKPSSKERKLSPGAKEKAPKKPPKNPDEKPKSPKKKKSESTSTSTKKSELSLKPKSSVKQQSRKTKKIVEKWDESFHGESTSVKKKCEDYKGNFVPELNLPVATTLKSSMSNVKSSVSNSYDNDKPEFKVGLSPKSSTEKATVLNDLASDGESTRNYFHLSEQRLGMKVENPILSSARIKLSPTATPITSTTGGESCYVSGGGNDISNDKNNIYASQSNVTSGDYNPTINTTQVLAATVTPGPTATVIFTTSNHLNHNQSISLCGGNTISLNPVTLSPSSGTISSSNSLSLTGSSNPVGQTMMVPATTALLHHNSPVTLILPRILPQSTITNSSHHQTSFKLVVSSPELNIPTFVPSSSSSSSHGSTTILPGGDGTPLNNFQLQQQYYSTSSLSTSSTTLQNVNMVASSSPPSLLSSLSAAATSLLVTPCDNESTKIGSSSNNKNNTITFIRDANAPYSTNNTISTSNNISQSTSPVSSSATMYQVVRQQQTILPNQIKTSAQQMAASDGHNIHHQSQNQNQSNSNNNNHIFIRKDFIEPEENHLNLLATVAQEFGSRDDLGKLVSSGSSNSSLISSIGGSFHQHGTSYYSGGGSSRGSSLMTSPVHSMQSPEVVTTTTTNFFQTTTTQSFPTATTTTTIPPTISYSLPTSPVANNNANVMSTKVKTIPSVKSSYDEYEYDERELEEGSNDVSPGSYKNHPVWLKIPQVIPKAATKVAEKLLKAQRKQEKAIMKKVTCKKPKTQTKTKKRDNLPVASTNILAISVGETNDNTQMKGKNKKSKPITPRVKNKEKASLVVSKKQKPSGVLTTDGKVKERSKINIPKLSKTSVKSAKEPKSVSRSRSRSPEKAEKKRRKSQEDISKVHSNMQEKDGGVTNEIPKVAKIRIKLSETDEPTLMSSSMKVSPTSNKGESSSTSFNIDKKEKVPKKKHHKNEKSHEEKSLNNVNSDLIQRADGNYNICSSSNKKKRTHDQVFGDSYAKEDGVSATKMTKTLKTKTRKELLGSFARIPKLSATATTTNSMAIVTTTGSTASAEDLSSSFTSLTPPPTAKPLLLLEEKDRSVPGGSSHPMIFSTRNFENENESTTENENENDFNWVSDPTFAVSAIRISNINTGNQKQDENHNHSCNVGGHPRDGNGATGGGVSVSPSLIGESARRKSEDDSGNDKKDKRKSSKPSKLSLLNLHNQTEMQINNDNNYGNNSVSGSGGHEKKNNGMKERDVKSQLKSFVHFAPKRVKVPSPRHHVKPCLKAEPVVRPLSSISSSSEDEVNSDAEIDLEVATLTNSISPTHSNISKTSTSLPFQAKNQHRHYHSQYNGHGHKSQHQQAAISDSNGNKSNLIKSVSQSHRGSTNKKRRASTTHSSKEKHVRRRLSLNLETGKTHETIMKRKSDYGFEEDEELPDIVGDYDLPCATLHQQYHQQLHSSSSTSNSFDQPSEFYENKQMNGGSGSSSYLSSGGSSTKKLPKKRSSRSSTATSDRPSSSMISNKSSSYHHMFANTTGDFEGTGGRHTRGAAAAVADVLHEDETLLPGKIELESVAELLDEMRILTEIQGLFYTGKLNALQPPDVYGVTLDNERGAPPHLIFSAEEVLEKCIREKKPQTLTVGLRICAYWSPQYSGLYPGRVSTDFNPHFDPEKDLIPIEFDDGDTGMIKLGEIRLLPANHPINEYDPNPLLTLEKKHRKRRHSSANTNSGPCTGDHEEADCGESYCAKVAKYEEEEGDDGDDDDEDAVKDKHHSFKSLYWTWTGLGYKRPKSKKNRNKEFFRGIQRGDEVINVGDSAIFISHGNERPYIGRVERFWEKKGQKIVNVRWFYHPEEVKSPKRIPHLKFPGALFDSPHIDENDVQTIAKKCDVLPFPEFKEKIGRMPKLSLKNSNSSKPRDLYYVAGYYDPYNYNLQLKI